MIPDEAIDALAKQPGHAGHTFGVDALAEQLGHPGHTFGGDAPAKQTGHAGHTVGGDSVMVEIIPARYAAKTQPQLGLIVVQSQRTTPGLANEYEGSL